MSTEIKSKITNTIGKVIFNFNFIEKKIDSIISKYFNIEEDKNEFFKSHLLNTSIITFASKIKLLKQIFENLSIDNYKPNIKLLEEVNKYRNIFAHCSIEFEEVKMNIEDLKELETNSNGQIESKILEAKLKNVMNAQGKITDKKFFELSEEFKEKIIEIEINLNEMYKNLN